MLLFIRGVLELFAEISPDDDRDLCLFHPLTREQIAKAARQSKIGEGTSEPAWRDSATAYGPALGPGTGKNCVVGVAKSASEILSKAL